VTLTSAGLGLNFLMGGTSDSTVISLPVALPVGFSTVSVGGTSDLRFAGIVSGPGALHKYGEGDLLFTGDSPNTFSGGFYAHLGLVRLVKDFGPALVGPVYVGATNSTDEVTVEYGSHHPIADTAEVYVAGREAWLDLDGYNDTFHSLTLADAQVSTGGFSTWGVLRLNGDLRAAQEDNSGNWVPTIFGKLNLGNVAHNFHVATNSGLLLHADVESTGTNGGFNLLGGGYIYIDGSNSFTGPLRLLEGSVSVHDADALGSPVGATILEGGEMSVVRTGHTFTEPLIVKTNAVLDFYGTNGWNGPIQIPTGTKLTLYGGSYGTPDVLTLGGLISGAGTLVLSSLEADIIGSVGNTLSGRTEIRGASVVRMNKTSGHAFAGAALYLEGGSILPELHWKRDHQVADTTRIEFASSSDASGKLYLENHSDTVGSLDNGWGATINCGTGTLTIGADNLNGRYFGAIFGIAGATNLIKIGAGSFNLSGSHSLPGKTVVNGGALILNNASGVGPVHVSNGARLAGHGGLGALTVGATASVTPGTSLGGVSLGTLRPATFNLGGGYLGLQLANTNADYGYDRIVAAGPINLTGVLLQLSAQNLPHGSNSFTIVEVTSGVLTGEFLGLPEGEFFSSSDGKSFRITYHGGSGNDVVISRHYTIPPAGTLTGVTRLPDGRMQIGGTGLPFESYRVLANTNLSTSNWIDIGSVSSGDESGALEFIDNDASNFPMRFYRFVLP
jgi:autotransporter-associated beta strand protein